MSEYYFDADVKIPAKEFAMAWQRALNCLDPQKLSPEMLSICQRIEDGETFTVQVQK